MKGIIFTEFLRMVEERFSADTVDDIILAADLPSKGAYTAVGSYPHTEIVQLVQALAQHSGLAVPVLVKAFGTYLFARFVVYYPQLFKDQHDAFQMLEAVDNHIHVEVLKLYPEAELPKFVTEREAPHILLMTYSSKHPFGVLAEGLLEGCLAHFQTPARISTRDLSQGASTCVQFRIERL